MAIEAFSGNISEGTSCSAWGGGPQIHSPSRGKGCWDASTRGWVAREWPGGRGFEIFDPSQRPPISAARVCSCCCVFQAILLLVSRTECRKGLEPSRKYCSVQWRRFKQKFSNRTESLKPRTVWLLGKLLNS